MSNLDEQERQLNAEEDAALLAAHGAEDADETEAQQEAQADESTDEPEQGAEGGDAQAPAADDPEKPDAAPAAGVKSKDGNHVLPFAVLQSARLEKKAERDARLAAEAERDALRQQLEDVKAGKKPTVTADEELEAEIAEASADFPLLGKLYEQNKTLRAEVQAVAGKRGDAAQPGKAAPAADLLQDDIDAVPALAEWQATDGEKFEAAKLIDAALLRSPKWQSKPQVERFREVARKVAEQFDIQIEDPSPSPRTPSKADPRAAVANAARTAPNTLSDFKGGAADNGGRVENLPGRQLRARIDDMTDDELDAHLARLG